MKYKKSVVEEKVLRKEADIMFFYGKEYLEWKDKHRDDRKLYCNIMEGLIEALEDLNKCRSVGMFVAYSRYERAEFKTLDEIKERFKGGEEI